MFRNHRKSLAVSLTLAIAVLAVAAHRSVPASVPAALGSSPVFGEEFWKRWGDGKGEVSGYDLTFPRYGELRKGVAVVVFVTETFSNSARDASMSLEKPGIFTRSSSRAANSEPGRR